MYELTITVRLSDREVERLALLTKAFQLELDRDTSTYVRRLHQNATATATTCFYYGLNELFLAIEERKLDHVAA